MSTGKVTTTADEIGPKTPGALRVVFSKSAGNKTSLILADINDWDYLTKEMYVNNVPVVPSPVIYYLPATAQTPIIIDFANNTIKIGVASPVAIGFDLTNYQQNPTIQFKKVIDPTNSVPIGNDGWISNQEWFATPNTGLKNLTLQPDTDTGAPGGITIDNINIIIKP